MALPTITTETDVANIALAEIGGRQLTDLETDTSEEAKTCRQWFALIRDGLLSAYQWNFATTRADLTAATDPDTEWTSAWTLPDDHVRLIRIVGLNVDNPLREFALEGNTLLVNGLDSATDTLSIVYVSNAVAVTDWDALFIEALVYKLAAKIAPRIAQNDSLATNLLTKFQQLALPAATNKDAREVASGEGMSPQRLISQSPLCQARYRSR